jgi:hypothetical protein
VIDATTEQVRPGPSSSASTLGTARRWPETLPIEAGWLVIALTGAMLVITLLGMLTPRTLPPEASKLAKRRNVAEPFREICKIEPGDRCEGFRLCREQSLQRADLDKRGNDPQLACISAKGRRRSPSTNPSRQGGLSFRRLRFAILIHAATPPQFNIQIEPFSTEAKATQAA